MSRPQSHRKSLSTSALSIIASSPGGGPSRRPREKSSRSGLERVEEASSPGTGSSGDRTAYPMSPRSETTPSHGISEPRQRGRGDAVTLTEARTRLNELLSLRASPSARLRALQRVEECLLQCCLGTETEGLQMPELLSLNIHANLLILLTRHTQLLTSRAHSHSSLHASDETAAGLVPELLAVFGILQGLCLLSATSKSACAEEWAIEMLIDLLLLLRSIPAPASTTAQGEARPVVYSILELFFCILVDSPEYSRIFERLSGLEAVTRVLKGSSVSKDVRMKCIEFLYFYLLPEHQSRSLPASTASSRSTSTSSSGSLFPPSPLQQNSHFRQSPRILQPPRSPRRADDLDLQFVPQTPRKKASPNLGYLTPSNRRASGSSSATSTPALHTVPASPVDQGCSTPKAVRQKESDAEVGLGLGLPKTTATGGMKRDVTAIHLGALVSSPESSSSARRHVSREGRPTSAPSAGMSRSSTQPNLFLQPEPRKTSASHRKPSRSPLAQSAVPETPRQRDGEGMPSSSRLSSFADSRPTAAVPTPHAPRIRHSMTSSHLSASLAPTPRSSSSMEPKSPRMRHSRTSSHLSALSLGAPSSGSSIARSPSGFLAPTPSHSRVPSSQEVVGMERTPSKARRAFPSELTRGILPTPSSPKPTPLGHSRRPPSQTDRSTSQTLSPPSKGAPKVGLGAQPRGVRSVEEKKELLGQWLGNVDALITGVEGVGWWGTEGQAKAGRD